MILCGKCLHARDNHEKHNGHFMYCPACQKLCDIDEFLLLHKPTEYAKVVEIGARKQ